MSSSAVLDRPATWPGDGELISPDEIAKALRTTKGELAETIGLSLDALTRKERISATKTQMRLRELWEILNRISERQGGLLGAYAWVRSFAIPGHGGETPAQIIRDGRANQVHRHLDAWFAGGYA
ncbi:MAG: hypothetical protein AAF566_13755 [Pseudomonadota bacterium]